MLYQSVIEFGRDVLYLIKHNTNGPEQLEIIFDYDYFYEIFFYNYQKLHKKIF